MESKVVLKKRNPHDKANTFSKLLLTWSIGLFRRGYKQGLTISDLWRAPDGDFSGSLGDRLERAWQKELDNAKKYCSKPSFSKAIVRSFWAEYMLCGLVVAVIYIIIFPLIPYTLALFIDYFANERTKENYRNAHIYNFLMNLFSLLYAFMSNHAQLTQGRVGMRVRIACCSLLYRKVLKLNHIGLSNTEPGQVINLMSNDVNRFDLVVVFLHFVWIAPIVATVVSYLIWQHVGVATLAALCVIFIQSAFVQVYLSNLQGKFRGKIARNTDKRVKVMSELINGIQVIKMYAWEKPFEKLVDLLRKKEVSNVLKTSFVKGFSVALAVFTERLILFATLAMFVLLGGDIRAQITFSLAQYFNIMQMTCNIFFPFGLAFLAEASVSIKRLEEFLLLDENEPENVKGGILLDPKSLLCNEEKERTPQEITKLSGLSISNVSASWQPNTDVANLKNISLTAKPGEFIGVAGPVGSGKSSLLQLILGELRPKKGTISLGAMKISYASQNPWLFVATVRENILFGLEYDRMRYKKVVKACALLRDFELLPYGDSTLIGERGISLSGGQRARIGLARACYRQADMYLLDDPLSAVDTHVGKHLVTECFMGLLERSTRILVTHQLHHLKFVDKVVILRHGEIEIQGSFQEVSCTPLFAELQQEEDEGNEASKPIKMQRSISVQSNVSSTTLENTDNVIELDQEAIEEMSSSGSVSSDVYFKYFRAGGGWCLLTSTVIAIILAQVVTSCSDLWLTQWMNDVEQKYALSPQIDSSSFSESNSTSLLAITETSSIINDVNVNANNITVTDLTEGNFKIDHIFYIYVWAAGILGCIIITTGRTLMFLWVCMRSSINLHNRMFSNVLTAAMHFFNTNPSGRILNRFSKDMGTVDEILPRMYIESIQIFMIMLGILVMVAIVNPYMLLTTGFCAIIMYLMVVVYLRTAQAIKRVEGISRSPVFSHVTATMYGLDTVRACQAEHMLRIQFDEKQDVHTAAWFLALVTNTAFSIWLSLLCGFYVIVVAYTFLFLDDGQTKSGNVGLAISQSLILVGMVQYGVKQATEVIAQMISVERVLQYTSLPQEKTEGPSPPSDWPKKARIVFKDLSLRYDENSEPVLKKLNIIIESGWKVGVVGRTGAGKSSLISALFRLAPIEGKVCIDDVDTGKIALKDLRSKIAIIPQEPVLFSATLRYNMDPFDKYTDAEIWQALEQVELKSSVTSLSSPVASGGTNFSAGQRQLLCLARAALARNKLLVLDEATANVDPSTDALIQRSIRKHFAHCSVITVAHRLHTVADSDRVIVMEAGCVVECGHPHELLQNSEGNFTKMVQQLGPASEQSLRDVASAAFSEHNSINP